MNPIQKIINTLDQFQQRYRLTAFSYAVIKKYGEDQAGYQSALLTYYAFLSLFPLLLVLTTVTSSLAHSYPGLQHGIIQAVSSYIPSLGDQLSRSVHTQHKTGIALLIGTLFTLYGARGVADAFRNGVNHLWRVPLAKRDGFPKAIFKSLSIIMAGGLGLILASVCTGLAAAAGQGWLFRILSLLVNVAILTGLFSWLINMSLSRRVAFRQLRSGALTAAIGLVLLQTFGALVLKHELKSLDAVYSNFAIALGLLFWLYLQAQVVYYSVEVSVVHTQQLWPRSLAGNLTTADKRSLARQAQEAKAIEDERIDTNFTD